MMMQYMCRALVLCSAPAPRCTVEQLPNFSKIWQQQLRFANFQQARVVAVADFLAVSTCYQLHKLLLTCWQLDSLGSCVAGVAMSGLRVLLGVAVLCKHLVGGGDIAACLPTDLIQLAQNMSDSCFTARSKHAMKCRVTS